uniref:probable ATP-dependent DNA helicase HFM1 n=1 Tax=Myodes glareolus TaxID=447135 RepID=UPI00202206B2|nr:probable ATP-dependent DNA helicase HFM1 [Myodes glareolus]
MPKSNSCFPSLDNFFLSSADEAGNFPVKGKSLDWFLPPAPLISEIPDIQALEEEIESHKLLGQEKIPKMITSNLQIINEDKNCISPTQKFHFPYNVGKDSLNLGGASNDDLFLSSRFPGKLVYGSSQKYKDHLGTKNPPAKNGPGDSESPNVAEDGGEGTPSFKKSPGKLTQTKINKKNSWNCSNNKQKLQYSTNKVKAKDEFPGSETGENIFEVPVFSVASQPHDVQGITPSSLSSLKAVTEIPAKFRSIFKEFPYFNYIQSKAFDDLLYTDRNFVICAPTGSGKTVVFELAITRLLMEVPLPWLNMKIVYMAPIKALCSQRFDDWKEKFGSIGLNCKELTGDTVMDDLFEIQHTHIIMTTPEKWDSMTRKWRDNSLVQLVRLFLIDEVHIIKDENRGPTLEVVVSRMKTVQSSSRALQNDSPVPMRFVAVSATIPNAEDIAEWLSDGERPAVCLKMDESHRPVKLQKVVLGFPCGSNQTEFKFDLALNYKVYSVIRTYSDQKPTLVFCATRKGVQQAASVLVKDAKFIISMGQKLRLQKSAYSIRDSKLKDVVVYGVGYHHAGLELSDRKLVEELFTSGDLPVLFTTSTLAMGVNLPAHLVVIKSTMHYIGGMFEEYSETDILQMIGRAGRPQFDTTATAVIMTRLSTREKYVQMLACNDTVESSLHRHLIEHLNAEIVLHTITDVNIALDWIRSTLLYIRALKNPSHYGFVSGLNKDGIEAKLQELCLKNLKDLSSLDLIKMDEDAYFKPTGISLSNTMVNAGLTSFKKIEEANAREIELILSRLPPFGTQIKEAVMYLPKYELEVEQISRYSDTKAEILVTVVLRNFEQLQTKRTAPDTHYATLIIGDADNQVVLKHKIMDSVLLKSGHWAKKIDVKRAFISEDLSINLISSDYVGLDIQKKFTVFYLGPRRCVNQTVMQGRLETDISHPKHSNRAAAALCSKGMATCKKPGNRECNHHCKSKHTCAHDCCKIGVPQKAEVKESAMSSYLSDLKSRDAVSSLPPVKRLKIQMNKSQNVDLKEFGFTPRPSLSSISRSGSLNIPELPMSETWSECEVYGEVPQEPSEYHGKDFLRWSSCITSNERTPQTVMFSRHANTSGNHSVMGESKCSEVLDVNFELGNEVWDDFDDESLVEVMSFSAKAEKTAVSGFGDTCDSSPWGSKLPFQKSSNKFQREISNSYASSHGKPDIYLLDCAMSKSGPSPVAELPLQTGSANLVNFQDRRQPTLSPVIERVSFTRSNKTPQSLNFQEMDIFIGNSDSRKEIDLSKYYPDDAAEEKKALLGIFKDIF